MALMVRQAILIGGKVVLVAKLWPSFGTVKLPYITWATACEYGPIDA